MVGRTSLREICPPSPRRPPVRLAAAAAAAPRWPLERRERRKTNRQRRLGGGEPYKYVTGGEINDRAGPAQIVCEVRAATPAGPARLEPARRAARPAIRLFALHFRWRAALIGAGGCRLAARWTRRPPAEQ